MLFYILSTVKVQRLPPGVHREGVTCLYVYFNTRVARIIRNLLRHDPRPD